MKGRNNMTIISYHAWFTAFVITSRVEEITFEPDEARFESNEITFERHDTSFESNETTFSSKVTTFDPDELSFIPHDVIDNQGPRAGLLATRSRSSQTWSRLTRRRSRPQPRIHPHDEHDLVRSRHDHVRFGRTLLHDGAGHVCR